MGFLRRLLGSDGSSKAADSPPAAAADPTTIDAEERAYELELLKGEQARLDELAQRQIRYAKYAWQPPAQGGERRADDHDRKT